MRKQLIIDTFRNEWGALLSKITSNGIRVYWWNRGVNFGDLITPYLLRQYGYTPLWSKPKTAQLVSTGSILQHMPKSYKGLVIGSGYINDDDFYALEEANVKSVRGKLSRQHIGGDCKIMLGDPGLLAGKFVIMPARKKWKVGIVPHFVDADNPAVKSLENLHGADLHVIDVCRQPEDVWRDLAACEIVISSSLHGIICSDAIGVPTCWIRLSDGVIGEGYKFRDYYSAFDENYAPRELDGSESLEALMRMGSTRSPDLLSQYIADLDSLFSSL